MHGGAFYKRETHGDTTLRAIKQRKQERALLKEMKALNKEIEEMENDTKKRRTNRSPSNRMQEKIDLYQRMISGEATARELVRLSLLRGMITAGDYVDFLKIEKM